MRAFNISTNLTNGAGLQRDYELMRRMLESYGHRVNGLMFNNYEIAPPICDISIFLEVINPPHIGGRQNWFIPNSEWYYPCWNGVLPRFCKILCKTKDCYDIWCKKVGVGKCVYIGFESLDFYRPEVVRKPEFLHMAGKSETKNTKAVCDAWREFKLPYPLTVVAFKPEIAKMAQGIPNVTWVERYTDEQVAQAMNENIFHVMPSKYEGFGHYIHEAIGCGGVVLTTDAAPMNQFNGIFKPFLIPVERREKRLEAFFNLVSPKAVAEVVHRAANTPAEEIESYRQQGRAAFLSDRDFFRDAFKKVANAAI